jgi:hypothetical protein
MSTQMPCQHFSAAPYLRGFRQPFKDTSDEAQPPRRRANRAPSCSCPNCPERLERARGTLVRVAVARQYVSMALSPAFFGIAPMPGRGFRPRSGTRLRQRFDFREKRAFTHFQNGQSEAVVGGKFIAYYRVSTDHQGERRRRAGRGPLSRMLGPPPR